MWALGNSDLSIADTSHLVSREEAQINYVNQTGDKMTGELNMTNHKITNLPMPVTEKDVACKNYVDIIATRAANFATATLGDKHFIYGEKALEMKVNIDMNNHKITELGAPTGDRQPTTKKYVDEIINGIKIQVDTIANSFESVDTFYVKSRKAVDMDNKKIIKLQTPENPNDAATKGYVDSKIPKIETAVPLSAEGRSGATTGLAGNIASIIPITIDSTINKPEATIKLKNINLGVTIDNSAQVVVIFYHPFISQIKKEILGVKPSINKLNLILTLVNKEKSDIGRIIMNGIICVMKTYTTETFNGGGVFTVTAGPTDIAKVKKQLTDEKNKRALADRQWKADETSRIVGGGGGSVASCTYASNTYPLNQLGGFDPCNRGSTQKYLLPKPQTGDSQDVKIRDWESWLLENE